MSRIGRQIIIYTFTLIFLNFFIFWHLPHGYCYSGSVSWIFMEFIVTKCLQNAVKSHKISTKFQEIQCHMNMKAICHWRRIICLPGLFVTWRNKYCKYGAWKKSKFWSRIRKRWRRRNTEFIFTKWNYLESVKVLFAWSCGFIAINTIYTSIFLKFFFDESTIK